MLSLSSRLEFGVRDHLADNVVQRRRFGGGLAGWHARMADALGLIEEQRMAAEAIRAAARTDIQALAEAGRAEFRALLSEEQIATLDGLHADHVGGGFGGPQGGMGSGGMGGRGFGGMRPGGAGGHGYGAGGDADHVNRLAEALALTDEQIASWTSIRETTQAAIEARQEEARAAFRALLTDEQLATLDELEAQQGRP